jgi:hypothetical protein
MRFIRPSFGPLVAGALCVAMAGCAGTDDVAGSDVPGSTQSVETLVRMGDYTLARGDAMTAIAFYRRNGFVDVAFRPRYYPDTHEDALVMLKPLRERRADPGGRGSGPGRN